MNHRSMITLSSTVDGPKASKFRSLTPFLSEAGYVSSDAFSVKAVEFIQNNNVATCFVVNRKRCKAVKTLEMSKA
jgi:hypothetical protein